MSFDPIALHRKNNKVLTEDDVLVPAYPGSGHALLGNVLLELGLNYCDPYTETFGRVGQSSAVNELKDYRRRLAATSVIDKEPVRGGARFVKTHLLPSDFDQTTRCIILLVRDPRDAVHSYYRWRLEFSEEGERGSFEEFLARPGVNGIPPCADWRQFCEDWLSRGREAAKFLVVRFEDLKRNGTEALGPLLRSFAPHVDTAGVARALDASSFDAMRAHEDRAAAGLGGGRIMRRGQVGEWREWFTGHLAAHFDDPGLRETASALGYTDWPEA